MPRFYTINFLFYVPSFYTLNLLYYAQFLYNKLALWCPQFLQNIWFSLKHTKHNYQLCHQTLQSPCCYVQRVAIKCLTLHRNIRPTGSALKTGIAQCSDAMRGNTTYIAVPCARQLLRMTTRYSHRIQGHCVCVQIRNDSSSLMFVLHGTKPACR